jgi:actin related protein 2/3 complex subunit 3
MVGTIPLLPIKTKSRGIAPPAVDEADDIIDETINTFRANTFFKNFDIKGGADRILIYLTLFIQECLLKLSAKNPTSIEGTLTNYLN